MSSITIANMTRYGAVLAFYVFVTVVSKVTSSSGAGTDRVGFFGDNLNKLMYLKEHSANMTRLEQLKVLQMILNDVTKKINDSVRIAEADEEFSDLRVLIPMSRWPKFNLSLNLLLSRLNGLREYIGKSPKLYPTVQVPKMFDYNYYEYN